MFKRVRNWYAGLSRAAKIVLGAFVAFFVIAGFAPSSKPITTSNVSQTKPAPQQNAPAPKIETKTVSKDETISFDKTTVNDSTLDSGKTALKMQGQNGIKTRTYLVTTSDGVQISKEFKGEAITKQPIAEVTAIGTKAAQLAPAPRPASNCDPNYSGACVPRASDVDCAGGSGNGPAYVSGPVYVVGTDIYDLDRDGDGVGCQ